jgi:hypothetical protein
MLTVASRFPAPGFDGAHPVHDAHAKRRRGSVFRHECYPEVETPQAQLPDRRGVQMEPDWLGKPAGPAPLFGPPMPVMARRASVAATPSRNPSPASHQIFTR